jgi:hypothetical protein
MLIWSVVRGIQMGTQASIQPWIMDCRELKKRMFPVDVLYCSQLLPIFEKCVLEGIIPGCSSTVSAIYGLQFLPILVKCVLEGMTPGCSSTESAIYYLVQWITSPLHVVQCLFSLVPSSILSLVGWVPWTLDVV